MKRITTVALSLLGAATLAVALAVGAMFPQSAAAQDATAGTAMPGAEATADVTLGCPNSTYALILVAQNSFGFQPPFDLGGFDLGKFGTAMMVTPEAMPTAEATPMATESAAMLTQAQCVELLTSVTTFLDERSGVTMQATAEATAGAPAPAAFIVHLSGPQEIPGPGDPDAIGTAFVIVRADANEICWTYNVGGLNLPASAAHIHKGAVDESGPVVVPLSPADAGGAANGCTTAPADVVSAILSNPSGYYVNVHNADFPNGALRGNLLGL